MYSIINYKCKVTLTVFDTCNQSDTIISLFSIKSQYRLSDNLLSKLQKTKEEMLDFFPTEYLQDLIEYTHFTFSLTPLEKLSIYYDRYVKNEKIYSVTHDFFPKKERTNFNDFVQFVLDTYYENLHPELIPYTKLKHKYVLLDRDGCVQLQEKLQLPLDTDIDNKIKTYSISDELLDQLNSYYGVSN